MANTDFQQVKLDSAGTYGAYNPNTNQAVAFPTQDAFTQFFGAGSKFDPNAKMATFDTSNLLGANAGKLQSVSMSSLSPATPLNVPTATPTPDALAPAVASGTQTTKSLQDYIKELTPPVTETSNQYNALSDQISKLLPGIGGRGEAQLKAEQDAGLPDLKKRLSDINAQLLTKVAEATKASTSYEQLIANLENPQNAQQQGIPMSAIIGQQAQVRKAQLADNNARAADIGLLQAYAQGLQGQVQAAQEGVNRAIDLKYQDRESELNLKLQQLSILEGKLNKEEAITAEALKRKYADEQAKIEEDKAKAKENISLAFQANVQTQFVNKNGEFYNARTGEGYSDPNAFFKAAGVKSFEEAYKKGLVTDVTPERLADLEFVSQLRAKYPDAGIALGDSAQTAQSKVSKSRIYQDQVRAPIGATRSSGGSGGATVITPRGEPLTVSPEAKAVIDGTLRLEDLTPTVRGKIASELTAAGYKSGAKLTAGQQQDIADMDTVSGMLDKIIGYNSDGKLEGVGFATGSIGSLFTKVFGTGSEEAKNVRALIGNVKGTIAKLRGGTSFTTNEEKLLNSYVPSINESAASVINKAKSLQEFIASKKANTLTTAVERGVPNSGFTTMSGPGGTFQVPNDKVELFKQNGYK